MLRACIDSDWSRIPEHDEIHYTHERLCVHKAPLTNVSRRRIWKWSSSIALVVSFNTVNLFLTHLIDSITRQENGGERLPEVLQLTRLSPNGFQSVQR